MPTLATILQACALILALAAALRVSLNAALAAYTVALSSEILLAYVSRPFELPIARHLNAPIALAVLFVGTAAAFAAGWIKAIAIIALSAFSIRLVQTAAYHRPGAVTPLWLAVTGLLIEAATISYIWIGQ